MIFQNKTRRTKLCDGSHKDTVSDKDLMRHFVCFAFSQSEKSLQILKKAVCALSHSVVSDTLVTPWTVAHQAPLSMGFPRQEYWNISFSRGSSSLRDWTCVSCIGKWSSALQTNLPTEPLGRLCLYSFSEIFKIIFTIITLNSFSGRLPISFWI